MKIITIKNLKNEIKQLVHDSESSFSSTQEVFKSWETNFKLIKEDESLKINGLRNPQIGAYYAILSHWTHSKEIVTVVLPTGTGKTETMLALFVSERLNKLLIIVPTDPLRSQISKKFLELGLLKKFGILNLDSKLPVVGTIKSKFSSNEEFKYFLEKSNVIVATASILSRLDSEKINELKNYISHIFIDEAHHSEASSWNKFREHLLEKPIIQFTATPFRNDNKKLDGKIIYNYPLRKAQVEGYFKPITFKKIYEYSNKDYQLAKVGIEQLRADKANYQHILLARVGSKHRANEVYEIYKKYESEFRIVKIHSGLTNKEKKEAQLKIQSLDVDIIICVDMLGEGFDLPNLKIAVFHDIRQSLPITLQFVGRFTRTKFDEDLGNATMIANLADLNVSEELEDLYASDPDWNLILPILSEGRTQKEIDLYNFIQGFKDNEDFPVNVQSVKPALSTVIYKNKTTSWFPTNYIKGITSSESYDLIRHNLNSDEKILVVLTARRVSADWINNEAITDLQWNYYVIYWDTKLNLLFIHSSDNSSLHSDMAKAIIGDDAELIDGDKGGKIFRILSGINRFKLQNVGLSEVMGKFIRFVMRVGSDIEPALSGAALSKAKKSMIFGSGYENGDEISIGCSYKGRIWSRRRNDIPTLIRWFNYIGRKVLDESIDAEEVLKGALVSKALKERPNLYPYMIDWNEDVYKESETRYAFKIDDGEHELYNIDLILINLSNTGNIRIALKRDIRILIELDLIFFTDANGNPDYKFEKVNKKQEAFVMYGRTVKALEHYLYDETPSIWFANGDYMEGNSYYELKNIIQPFSSDNIIDNWDWLGVDLNVESQDYNPKKTNSIQYYVIEKLKKSNYDIIFDDDGSGEISDVITLKKEADKIVVELYHLKYAIDGKTSKQIKNLYEVCGQVQKSVNWKFKKSKEILEHILRRESLRTHKGLESRFEKGNTTDIIDMLDLATQRFPLEFKIFLVQPGLSKTSNSIEQMTLLGVTENYLLDRALINLKVIGNK